MLTVLKRAQSNREIDGYAIFGYRADGSANGLTGRYLLISGGDAEKFIGLIKDGRPVSQGIAKRQLKPCNCR
jgi:hypothetical protein